MFDLPEQVDAIVGSETATKAHAFTADQQASDEVDKAAKSMWKQAGSILFRALDEGALRVVQAVIRQPGEMFFKLDVG